MAGQQTDITRNDILLNIVNIRMAIMICIGVILVREIYLVLNGYIAKAAYMVSALVVIAIAAITYGVIYIVNVNLIIYKTGMCEFTVIVIYMKITLMVRQQNTF